MSLGPEAHGSSTPCSSIVGTTNELNQALPEIPDRQRHETRVAEPTHVARYTLRSHARAARSRDHCVPVSFNDPSTVDKQWRPRQFPPSISVLITPLGCLLISPAP